MASARRRRFAAALDPRDVDRIERAKLDGLEARSLAEHRVIDGDEIERIDDLLGGPARVRRPTRQPLA